MNSVKTKPLHRAFSVMLATIMLLMAATATSIAPLKVLAAGLPDTIWYGDGSAQSFTLTDADQLAGLAQLVNSGKTFSGKTIVLGADIDLSNYGVNYNSGKGWITIGSFSSFYFFNGIFNGNNHTVTGLYINDSNLSCAGLFGQIYQGTVKDLGVVGANIQGGNDVGGVVGYLIFNGSVTNCYTTGTVSGLSHVGGVAGSVIYSSTVTNCHTTGTVSGNSSVGGVAGDVLDSAMLDCYSKATVSSSNGSVGGVAGRLSGSSIQSCYATGAINSPGDYVGGVAGYVNNGNGVQNCYSTGMVTGNNRTGGVVGYINNSNNISSCSVQNCYATGTITGNRSAGGVVGYDNGSNIQNCHSTATVNGLSCVGSVVGEAVGIRIERCYASGAARSTADILGGVAGMLNSGSFMTDCYTSSMVSGTSNVGGVVGEIGTNSKVQNCYATGAVTGDKFVGGMVGYISTLSTSGIVTKCSALNPSVKAENTDIDVGRVAGNYKGGLLSGNVAFSGMSTGGGAAFPNEKGLDQSNGADVTAAMLQTINGFPAPFTVSPWTYIPGKLPGLFGKTIEMPEHLRPEPINTVAGVTLDKTVASIPKLNGTLQLTPTVSPANATNTSVTWSSSNTLVATVSNTGLVTGKSYGTATITATTADGGKKASCTVTVGIPAISIKDMLIHETKIAVGQTTGISWSVHPHNTTDKVTITSSNPNVATVSQNGTITAKSPGTIDIVIKAGNVSSAKVTISVHAYVSMRIGKTTAVMNGKTTTIDNQGTAPFKISGKTMLPLRFVGEKMGGKVNYVNDKKPITMTYGTKKVEFMLKSKEMIVYTNGKKTGTVALDVAAQKKNGRTFIPLRAISQALGFDVYYQSGAEYIIVHNPKMTSAVRTERLNEAKKFIK